MFILKLIKGLLLCFAGNRKQSAKLTNALKNVYHSMRNILSKSQSSFSLAAANAAGKKSPVVSGIKHLTLLKRIIVLLGTPN